MPFLHYPHTRIASVAACLPEKEISNADEALIPENERALYLRSTGIAKRRIAAASTCASDLCHYAAEAIMRAESPRVEAIVFVTQTPDYLMPGNAALAQHRLGIENNPMCVDVHQGCAGYVYGLSVAAGLVEAGCGSVLLLAGDTLSRALHPQDKSTVPVFSDAGSATLLTREARGNGLYFHTAASGEKAAAILQRTGGWRNPLTEPAAHPDPESYMRMEGQEVFHFSVGAAVESITSLCRANEVNPEQIAKFYLHQANGIILESIRRRLGISAERMPLSLQECGNTSSASIPVTLIRANPQGEIQTEAPLIFCGFGAGLSWGSALVRDAGIRLHPLITKG